MTPDVGEKRTASDLCVQCGLCCTGAIFDFGPLEEEHKAAARSAGMRVIEEDGQIAFGIPCPCLDGAFCTNYENRPPTCRSYRCFVLKAYDEGKITFEQAQDRIEQGLAAYANLNAQLPDGKTAADARRWRREAGAADAAKTLNASPMVMMALGLLDVVLDEHFRGPHQRQVMPRE